MKTLIKIETADKFTNWIMYNGERVMKMETVWFLAGMAVAAFFHLVVGI